MSIFDIVNKKDLVYNLQNKRTESKDVWPLTLKKEMIKDEQDIISLAFSVQLWISPIMTNITN